MHVWADMPNMQTTTTSYYRFIGHFRFLGPNGCRKNIESFTFAPLYNMLGFCMNGYSSATGGPHGGLHRRLIHSLTSAPSLSRHYLSG
jgi:hypothetical protein